MFAAVEYCGKNRRTLPLFTMMASYSAGSLTIPFLTKVFPSWKALLLGSVQLSRLSSQFAFQCCNLPQQFTLRKTYNFISICISNFSFDVFKMGFERTGNGE